MFNFNVISVASGTAELVSDNVTYHTMCGAPEYGKSTVIAALVQVDGVNVRTSSAVYAENEIYNTDYFQK